MGPSQPMQTYCQLDPCEQISVKFEWIYFSYKEMLLKMSSAKRQPVCSGASALSTTPRILHPRSVGSLSQESL